MAASLYETARTIVDSSLPQDLRREERRLAIARRFYSNELPEAALIAHTYYRPANGALLRGLPSGVYEAWIHRQPIKSTGPLRLGRTGVLAEVLEDRQIGLQFWDESKELSSNDRKTIGVDATLEAEGIACFGDLMAVVEELGGLFEADSNEKADRNGGDVDKENLPRVHGSMGRMYVKHGYGVLLNSS